MKTRKDDIIEASSKVETDGVKMKQNLLYYPPIIKNNRTLSIEL